MRSLFISTLREPVSAMAARGARGLCLCIMCVILIHGPAHAQNRKPPVMLANTYHPGIDLGDYWVSEKYDGMRAYWDGTQLWSRGGESIKAPAWFTAGWPGFALDGELWAGRGRFQETVSTARMRIPDDAAWRSLRFMVFDLPAYGGRFDERLPALRKTILAIGSPWLEAVPQERIASHALLRAKLKAIDKAGGEGLMLHRGSSFYQAERNDDLLKMKLHEDAEALVVAHLPGKGRHAGRLGALLVEMPNGLRFRLGTGLTDAQREHPPPPGSWVSYRYRGFNDSGIPRFASFLRVRADMPLPANAIKSQHSHTSAASVR